MLPKNQAQLQKACAHLREHWPVSVNSIEHLSAQLVDFAELYTLSNCAELMISLGNADAARALNDLTRKVLTDLGKRYGIAKVER